MSDFSFMRSGFNMTDNNNDEEKKLEFIQMCGSIMRVLSDEACRSAAIRAQACGRNNIVGTDMILALKYEAHEFFQKDIEAKFLEYLQEERTGGSWIAQFLPQDNYETDEAENDEHATEEETDSYDSEDEDEFTNHSLVESATDTQRELYEKMKKYAEEWNDWNPDDPAQQLVKRSIDSIDERMRIN